MVFGPTISFSGIVSFYFSSHFGMSNEKQRLLAYAPLLARCHKESLVYGKCVSAKTDKVKHLDCAKEFDRLILCFRSQLHLVRPK